MTARIWKSTTLSPNSRLQLYNALVINTLLYACETWAITSQHLHRLEVFHNRCLRRLKGVTMLDHLTTGELHSRTPVTEPIQVWVRRAQLRWVGHLVRRDALYPPSLTLFAHAIRLDCPLRRHAGRPPMSFLEQHFNMISRLSRRDGALDRVIRMAQHFGVMFRDIDGSFLPDRHRIDWHHVALNRVLWSCVFSLGAMDY